MSKVIGKGQYTVVTNPQTGAVTHLKEGDEVPAELEDFVGDHLTEDASASVGPSASEQFDRPEDSVEGPTVPAGAEAEEPATPSMSARMGRAAREAWDAEQAEGAGEPPAEQRQADEGQGEQPVTEPAPEPERTPEPPAARRRRAGADDRAE